MEKKVIELNKWLLVAAALLSFAPVKISNFAMALVTVSYFLYMREYDLNISVSLRSYLLAFAMWSGTFILSALLGELPMAGFNRCLHWFIWRPLPFFVVVTMACEKKVLKYVLMSLMLGVTVLAGILIGQGLITGHRAGGLYVTTAMMEAGIMLVLAPTILVAYYDRRIFGKWHWLCEVAIIIVLGGMLANNTRGAWLSVSVACAVVVCQYVLHSKKQLAILGVVLCLFGGLFVAKPQLLSRWTMDPNSYSTISRVRMWTAAFNMWKDHPILGVGFEAYAPNYKNKYMLKMAPKSEAQFNHAHNVYIHTLAEEGLVGLFGFVFFWLYVLKYTWSEHRKYGDAYSMMIFASTLSFLIWGLTEYNVTHQQVMRCYWLMSGTCFALHEQFVSEKKEQKCE